jgi:hypothetical protein
MKSFAIVILHVVRALAIAWSCVWAMIAGAILVLTGSVHSGADSGIVSVVYSVLGACAAGAAWVALNHLTHVESRRGFDIDAQTPRPGGRHEPTSVDHRR